MKKILSILIAVLVLSTVFVFPACAAGTYIAFSSNTVTIGDTVTVTITVDPGEAMYAVGFTLKYDAEKLSYSGAAGAIKVVESPSGDKKYVQRFEFKTIAVGSAIIKVEDCGYAGIDLKDKGFENASATLTIKDVALSSNSNLSSLSVNTGTLSPKFSSATTKYTVSVPYETEKITLYAKTSDTKAKFTISSNPTNLKVGTTNIKVTVTAQDGSQKIYTVVVTRKEQGATDTPPNDDTPNEDENTFGTVISGKNYEIVTDIPEELYLKGFTLSSAEWEETQVPVLRAKDNLFTVYYLKEEGTTNIAPYTYNEEVKAFEALKIIESNDNFYILSDFPAGTSMPSNYYSTTTQIGNYAIKAYMDENSNMTDFVYVYCYVNGDYGIYRYDTKEGTIQRFPEVHLVDAPTSNEKVAKKDNFFSRLGSLSSDGLVLVFAIIIAAICIVLLIIFLIVMAIQKLSGKNKYSSDDDDYNLDDVTIIGDDNIYSNKK